jgi:2'-5' RNA ligase
MTDPSAASQRCFVGLWPDAAAAARLDALAQVLQREFPRARRVPRANLHLTLAFIGDLDVDRAARVAARLTGLDIAPFTWTVDCVGCFEGPRVAWAGGAASPGLSALVDSVQAVLTEERVRFDRRPYRPHVTVLRDVPRGAAGLAQVLTPSIAWIGGRPVLLRSVSGRYLEVKPPG